MSSVAPQPFYSDNDGIHLFKRCPLCRFHCRTLAQFRIHVERIHNCEDCNLYYADAHHHICPTPGQRGGHLDGPSRRAGVELNFDYFQEFSRSHRGAVITYQHLLPLGEEEFTDIEVFFSEAHERIVEFIQQLFNIHGPLKIIMFLSVLMEKDTGNPEQEPEQKTFQFYAKIVKVLAANSIPSLIEESKESIVQEKIERCERGSQWSIVRIEALQVKSSEMEFLTRNERPGSFLPMPFKKKGFVNFNNQHDNFCLQYCICASVFWEDELKARQLFKKLKGKSCVSQMKNHMTWKRYFSRFDFSGLEPLTNIYESLDKFERLNPNHAINVFTHHGKSIVLMRRTTETNADHIINLFLIHSVQEDLPVYHYVLILKLKKFLHGCIPDRVFFCQRCFDYYTTEQGLIDHKSECSGLDVQTVKFPPQGAKLKFNRPEMTLPYPFILVYDLETYSVPVDTDKARQSIGRSKSRMKFKSEFTPASYSFVIVQHLKHKSVIIHREFYDGENVIETFFRSVFKWGKKLLTDIRRVYNFVVPTAAELDEFNKATHCKFCGIQFEQSSDPNNEPEIVVPPDFDSDDSESSVYQTLLNARQNIDSPYTSKPKRGRKKVYHHLHLEGTFEAALCECCNLRVRYNQELVCIAHNASRFDSAFLVQHFDSELFNDIDIKVIAKSAEELMEIRLTCKQYDIPSMRTSFDKSDINESSIHGTRYLKVRFIDSFKYLAYSLSSLVQNLVVENNPMFDMLESCYGELFPSEVAKDEAYCKRNLHLLFRKVGFPYRFLTSPQVLEPGVPIPDRSFFDNDLTNEKITDEEWNNVQLVIKTFKIPDFKSFNRLYNLMDSCLLAIVFENFRRNSINVYGLDVVYNCSVSGYSWNCFLFHSKVELDYIRDHDMLELITKGIRGGSCFCTQKIVKANSPRFPNYDPSKPISHIVYFDQNSQYSHAMLNKLPSGNFQWVSQSELEQIDWLDDDIENWDTGYIIECQLLYPDSIHSSHSSLPMAPEKRSIKFVELGNYQKNVAENLQNCGFGNTVKNMLRQPRLLSTLYDKDHYVVKDSTLAFYIRHGLRLGKIYRGFKFNQEPYMASYINLNLEKRKQAKCPSESDNIKLTSNSLFGRTLQTSKNKRDVVFCKSSIQARKLTASPRCRDFVSISPTLSMFLMIPKKLVLDKPLQTGFCILDYAKKNYYSGFYDDLRGIWGDRITNLYIDTDCTISLLQDSDDEFWNDLFRNRRFFDFSKIPKNHDFFQKYLKEYPDLSSYNKGVSGVWKIESLDTIESCFLKSKQYSMLYLSGDYLLKTKGLPYAFRSNYKHNFLKDVILNKKHEVTSYKSIRSINHRMFIIEVDKLAFHSLDISRIFPCSSDINISYPFGHFQLRNIEEDDNCSD